MSTQMALCEANAVGAAEQFLGKLGGAADPGCGRGIVTCAGGIKYLTCAWVLIKMLRRLACTLPIEVWYLGEDEGDRDWIDLVRPLGVECIDAQRVAQLHPHARLGGWESKSYAILHSRFQEVLFLDADNVPVVDPTYLFDCEPYREIGSVFWPDTPIMPPTAKAWEVFGVPYREEREVESGQLLIDKGRCRKALSLCDWYNQHSDFFYQYVYGDKDTFRFAWHRVGQPFVMVPYAHRPIPYGLRQFDPSGQPLFQHRIHDKWSLAGNQRAAGFVHEDQCLAFVEELRTRWNPIRHLTRHLTVADRAAMRRLSGKRFRYERVGSVGWAMQLSDDSRIDNWAPQETYWWCDGDALVLAASDGKPAGRLTQTPEGIWTGRRTGASATRLRLSPLEHGN